MKKPIILIMCILMFLSPIVYSKDFIRYYTYRVGDDDSKNKSRAKAIEQVKLLLLEEIGVYIQSYINIEQHNSNSGSSVYLEHEIRTTTAGVTMTEILEEKWDGQEFKLKARIDIDVEDVIKKISDTIETRRRSKNIANLSALISIKESEITRLNTEVSQKELVANRQQIRVAMLLNKLSSIRLLLNKQTQKERRLKNDLETIKLRITKATNNVNLFVTGMTEREIIKIAGEAKIRDTCPTANDVFLNYGKRWVHLVNGVYKTYIPVVNYSGACDEIINF